MATQLNFNCNESWDKMPKTDFGSFCNKCSKNVIDLTNKSESEIQTIYQEYNGKLCGRIKVSQLQGSAYDKARLVLAKFCLALYLVFGGWLFNSNASAQITAPTEERMMLGEIEVAHMTIISGKVVDAKTKEPMIGVKVYFMNNTTKIEAVTNQNGNYALQFRKEDLIKDKVDIRFESIGYLKKKMTGINCKLDDIVLKVVALEIDPELILMGDVIWNHDPIIE